MRFRELLQAAERVSTPVKIKGRRRPGRNDQVSPHLIPLLRNPATADIPAPPPVKSDRPHLDERFALARDIGFGLMLSAPLWALIGAIAWMLRG